jgi:hypothetical protein
LLSIAVSHSFQNLPGLKTGGVIMHIFDRFFNGKVYGLVFKWLSLGGAGCTRNFSRIAFWLFSSSMFTLPRPAAAGRMGC